MLDRSYCIFNAGFLMGSYWVLPLMHIWLVGISQGSYITDNVPKCLDLKTECTKQDNCKDDPYNIYRYCNRVIGKLQLRAPAPSCPVEELAPENWWHCQRGEAYKKYELSIQLTYFDIVCCLQKALCAPCKETLMRPLCEGDQRHNCDLNLILKNPKTGQEVKWKAPGDTNKWGKFDKKSLRVSVDNSKVELRFQVIDRDIFNANDLLVDASVYLQPVYSCTNEGGRFINDDWLEHRDKEFCVTKLFLISDATKKRQMKDWWYWHDGYKQDVFVRTLWNHKIVRSENATKH